MLTTLFYQVREMTAVILQADNGNVPIYRKDTEETASSDLCAHKTVCSDSLITSRLVQGLAMQT